MICIQGEQEGWNLQDKVLERAQEVCTRVPLSLAEHQAALMQDKTPQALTEDTYCEIYVNLQSLHRAKGHSST